MSSVSMPSNGSSLSGSGSGVGSGVGVDKLISLCSKKFSNKVVLSNGIKS